MPWMDRRGSALRQVNNSAPSTGLTWTTITAAGSSHTKGAFSAGEIFTAASRTEDAFGLYVAFGDAQTAATNTSSLVDIGIGASGSETVLLENLTAGYRIRWAAGNGPVGYYFPLYLPAGKRISARAQSANASETFDVLMQLFGRQRVSGQTFGSRVTTYGANTSTSLGVTVSPGTNNSYGTAASIIASLTNPVRYLQVGISPAGDTTTQNCRGLLRLLAGGQIIADNMPFVAGVTESCDCGTANAILSRMSFAIPSGVSLEAQVMCSSSNQDFDVIAYGVD